MGSDNDNEHLDNSTVDDANNSDNTTISEEALTPTSNSDDPEELQTTLANAQKKADENWDKYVRAQAELDNLRRRTERDLENAHKYAIEQFSKELLLVKDSLELGLNAAEDENIDAEKLREGSELTLKELNKVMGKFGIEEINPEGEKFNPEHHQAMVTQPSDQIKPNHILTVYQKGYLLNNRLIRPAMVVVSQKPAD